MGGVDADELDAGAEIDLDQLPAVHELAGGIGGSGQPHSRPGCSEPDHGARIGTMHGDGLARGKHHVGEKALVAPDQRRRMERGRKAHASVPIPKFAHTSGQPRRTPIAESDRSPPSIETALPLI